MHRYSYTLISFGILFESIALPFLKSGHKPALVVMTDTVSASWHISVGFIKEGVKLSASAHSPK